MTNEFETVQTVPTLTLKPFAEENQIVADTKKELVKETEPELDDSILSEEEKRQSQHLRNRLICQILL